MEQAQPTMTNHLENRRCLKHFCHESRHALELTVTGANACQDSVDDRHLGTLAWNKAAELCHQRHHSNLQSNCYHYYYHSDTPTIRQHLRSLSCALSVELGTREDPTSTLETLRTAIRDVYTELSLPASKWMVTGILTNLLTERMYVDFPPMFGPVIM